MKAVATAVRARGGKRPSRVQRKVLRHAMGYDGHEEQADRRGERFARGDTGLSHGLSPIAAAGFVDPGSVGEPLAPRLRAQLETAFDADLSAVRIHRDAAARQAARRFGAAAFASGTAIYFGAGSFDPASRPGRALIGHELAHVLQQTGRVGSAGRIAATRVDGGGMIQCAPTPTPTPTPASAEEEAKQKAGFEDLVRMHRNSTVPTGNLELEKVIERVSKLTGGRIVADRSKPDFTKDLNAAALAGDFDGLKSGRARSFVFDMLKFSGWFLAAARLIAHDDGFKVRTVALVGDFITYLRDNKDYGDAWLLPWLASNEFSSLWPDAILRSWRLFYLRPTWVPTNDKKIVAKMAEIRTKPEALKFQSPPALRTEAYWLVWDLIGRLDDERIKTQIALRKQLIENAGKGSIFEEVAAELPAWRKQAMGKGSDDKVAPHERTLAAGQIPLIEEATAYWQSALKDYSAWRNAWTQTDAELADAATTVPVAKYANVAAEPVRGAFVDAVTALFATSTDDAGKVLLPAPDVYSQLIKGFVEAINVAKLPPAKKGADALSLADSLLAWALAEATAATPDPDRLAEIAILPLMFDELIGLALSYDAKVDQQSPHFDDNLRGHRLRLGRAILKVGRWLGWTEVIKPLTELFAGIEGASDDEIGKARLMLISDWEPDAVRPVVDLLEDFPKKADLPILADAPFTLRVLVEWFRYDFHRKMREALETLLLAENRLTAETKLDFGPLEHIRQTRGEIGKAMARTAEAETAIAHARQFDLKVPQRFLVKDFELLVPKGAKVDFFRLLIDHRKTELQLRRRATGILAPTDPSQGVFAWLIPPLDGLFAFMTRIPSIATIVARETGETDAAWLKRLAPADEGAPAGERHISPDDLTQLNRTLLKWLKSFGESEERQIPDLWRRTIILRRRHIALVLIPQIEDFAENPYVTSKPFGESPGQTAARLETPDRIIEWMRLFEGSARPMREHAAGAGANADAAEKAAIQQSVDVQMALMTFTLAPSLLKISPRNAPWRLKQLLYEYFALAIDFAEDDKKLKALKAGLGVQDEAASVVIPEKRRTGLVQGMKAFMTAFEEEVAQSQDERGICSENGKTIRPNSSHFKQEIEPGKPGVNEWHTNQNLLADGHLDPESGDKWRLVKVFVPFEFHPGIGAPPPANMRRGAGGPVKPARLTITQNGVATTYLAPDFPDITLFSYSFNDKTFVVNARQIGELERLSEIFLWRSIQISFEKLGEMIMTFEDWMMTVASLFFPEAAIAEFVVNVGQMIANDEFADIVQQLKDDPIGFAKHAIEQMTTKLFDPTNIWRFVLLGGQHSPLAALMHHNSGKTHKVRPTGKLGRVVAVLRSLGARFEGAMHRVHEYTQPPFRRAQGRIAMHPTLVWLLRRAAHIVETIYELIPIDMIERARKSEGPSFLSTFKKLVEEDKVEAEFRGRVIELFEGIQHIELPGELVDVSPAIELILGFVMSRFGSRGKLLRILLSTMPVPASWAKYGEPPRYVSALQFISNLIRDEWVKGSAIDPNTYWQNDVLPVVANQFNDIRDDLVDGLYEAADRILIEIGLAPLERPKPGDLTKAEVVPERVDYEGEASTAAGERPRLGSPQLSASGGSPLSGPSRARFEGAIGADFSHVRVHTNARAATRPVGANALTSGSHVFLRPGISPALPSGQRLLAHELTHVVQQTGARGGTPGRRVPTLGRPNVGMRYDRGREAAADRVASHFSTSGRVPPSVRRGIGSFQGIQPSIEGDLADSVLTELSKADAKSFTKDLEGGKDPEGYADAKALADQILDMIRSNRNLEFKPFMRGHVGGVDVAETVRSHMVNRLKEVRQLQIEIKKVAMLAQKPKKKEKGSEVDTELNPKGFVQLLANYLFATCDVAMKIDHDTAVKKISKIELFGLNIAEVGGTSPLWKMAMSTSFSTATVHDMEKAQREMRERLRDLGPQPNIWDSTQFKFASHVINAYLELLRIREQGTLDDVPKVRDYIETKNSRGDSLAIGTHGELTSSGRSIGSYNRESHHTTQYLLIEFFSNHPEASRKAFPGKDAAQLRDDFDGAGIDFDDAGIVRSIEGIGAPLGVSHFNPNSNRGANMPAILLSARCHQRGELHILRAAKWDAKTAENVGTMTQGFAIENEFNKSIANDDLRPRDDSRAQRAKLKAAIQKDKTGARVAYYKAALATYKWMNGHMIPALSEGMLREEYAYYRGIAARNHTEKDDKLHSDWDLKPEHLTKVHNAAKANNEALMGAYNWKAS